MEVEVGGFLGVEEDGKAGEGALVGLGLQLGDVSDRLQLGGESGRHGRPRKGFAGRATAPPAKPWREGDCAGIRRRRWLRGGECGRDGEGGFSVLAGLGERRRSARFSRNVNTTLNWQYNTLSEIRACG